MHNNSTSMVILHKDTNGNTIYRKDLATGLEEWMWYLGNILTRYKNSDGKYIEYDIETGEPMEYIIPH